MALFDWYEPTDPQLGTCPMCGNPLREWQGKDGPAGGLVWRQGTKRPIDQRVDDDVRLPDKHLAVMTLPERFVIYSYACPNHRPIVARCMSQGGIWTKAELEPFHG
jgi:hypothetical protein